MITVRNGPPENESKDGPNKMPEPNVLELTTLGGADDGSITFKRGVPYGENGPVDYVEIGRGWPITPGLYRLDMID